MTEKFRITKSAELTSLAAFRDFIDQVCRARAIDSATCYDLKLAIDEACTNIITHGYVGLNPGSIILDLEFQAHQIVMYLTDFGHAFEPCEPPAPDVNAVMEGDPASGFGLFLIYRTMDRVDYQTTTQSNTLILTKNIVPKATA